MANKNTLPKKGSKIGEIFRMREVSLLLVLILLCAVIQMRNNQFLTFNVINGIFKNYAYTMILAFGMMFESTEITPLPPSDRTGTIWSSLPE